MILFELMVLPYYVTTHLLFNARLVLQTGADSRQPAICDVILQSAGSIV